MSNFVHVRHISRCVMTGLALASAPYVAAQVVDADPDLYWRENKVPPAPALTAKRMVRIEMPVFSSMTVGVDVDTVQVSKRDGVVRYVAVLQGRNGMLSAYYQGVHCNSFTGRTYARYVFDEPNVGWQTVEQDWQDLTLNKSFYARSIAKSGACENSVPASNTAQAQRAYARNNRKWRLEHPQITKIRTHAAQKIDKKQNLAQ